MRTVDFDRLTRDGERYARALAGVVETIGSARPAFAAYLSMLPTISDVMRDMGKGVDPDAIYRCAMRCGNHCPCAGGAMGQLVADWRDDGIFSADAASAARRALRGASLSIRIDAGAPDAADAAEAAMQATNNLTMREYALRAIAPVASAQRERMFAAFETLYAGEPLVLDNGSRFRPPFPERETLARVRRLMRTRPLRSKRPTASIRC